MLALAGILVILVLISVFAVVGGYIFADLYKDFINL